MNLNNNDVDHENIEQVDIVSSQAADNKSRLQSEKQEKQKLRERWTLIVVILFVIVALTLTSINLILDNSRPDPQLYIVTEDRLNIEVDASALILRNENLISANRSGILRPYKNSGEKVAIGDLVARIFPESAQGTLNQIDDLDRQISERQVELISGSVLPEDDGIEDIYLEYDKELEDYVNQIRTVSNTSSDNNFDKNIDEKITLKLRERSQELSTLSLGDETITNLISSRNNLQQSLEQYASNIYSPYSGVVSYLVDDYSKPLNESRLGSLTAQVIDADHDNTSKLGETIESGAAAFNIIDEYSQYINVALEQETAELFTVGDYYVLDFPEQNISLEDANLAQITQANEDGLVVLSFRSRRNLEILADIRKTNVSINLSSTRGLKAPNNAILENESTGEFYVMVMRSGYVYRQKINRGPRDNNYSIISTDEDATYVLRDGSIIIQNPEVVESGESIRR